MGETSPAHAEFCCRRCRRAVSSAFQTMPDGMDASIIRIGVNFAPDWYFTQSIT